ncbi:MAG: RnfABCDGE type electron transport complex subunit A [Tissierellia bacterium]|jgi:electron transport complex protein RnfA|nr:RnfABCDGE type electron transport complex subunit A [Tissierellia bacterium]MDD3227196.1 RnfABCDGE type electron transport complex subunit A [Tissierellia bacterium]MDD3751405.1 RnfABCDGE type electron transport complex subunit A [Tissierellia bacterium]MDD4046824.1 RnfABCDGE type electron transport complex subunit A [Tissierellia bacterium]MDD4678794.1 RnfABCDGE type electron transport complex subunit A [Tissierellia bacterium]
MDLVSLFITSFIVNNIIFMQFLGACPFLGVSKKIDTAAGMGIAVIFVITLASIITFIIYHTILVTFELEYLQTIVFILIIAALVQFVEMFLKKSAPGLYQALGIFLPLITTNCAVLGVAINNIIYEYEFIESLVYSVGTSAGFLLAIVLFAGVRDKVDYADLPDSLKGSAISLITAGLMSVAFLGFSGLQL